MLTTTQELTRKNSSKPISTKVISSTPGRLRLRVAQPHCQSRDIHRIASVINANPQVDRVSTNLHSGSITIYHDGKNGSLDNIFATLRDLGIIFADLTEGKTEAAAQVTNAVVDLNQRVRQATNGAIDVRFLFPLGLSTLAVRQLLSKGLQFETIPWYVLAWYAFDSFIKLHGTSASSSTSD
ncbi:MAG TPA: hypothetical protein DEV81_08485 [Cyanobacteria bacterium UBA11049]|nr:hypothetical protein [Cyanobacteria bacterium UBA11049]